MHFPRHFNPGPALLALLLAAALPDGARAGSAKAFHTLVVVNTNSANSIELGDYYAAAHQIPAHHICRLGIATNLASLTSNEFHQLLWTPITNHLAAENLNGQIDYLVLSWAFPTRVRNVEGVPAALFYGFKNAPAYNEGDIGCNMPEYTSNQYFRAERAFRSADGWNATNGFVAFHLIASNLPAAKQAIDRGAAAQSSFPSSAIYLQFIGDQLRGIRERRFPNTQFSFTSLPGLPVSCIVSPYYDGLNGYTNVIGYHDGYPTIRSNSPVRTNNAWLPGAYADLLTSLGGVIPPAGQSTILDWMEIGATASYGTVAEPCNYLEKYPDPLMGFWYARGFTIGEAYAMAVESPYQGLFAGDPLAAPFAAPPAISALSHAPYQIVTGTIPVLVSATAHPQGVPAAALDLYLDGRFHANLAALAPTPGNLLSVAVAGVTSSVAVATNDSLFDAVAALAEEVNGNTNQIVFARARGDRLELVYKAYNLQGNHAPVSAAVAQGTADALTLATGLAATNLHPATYRARKTIHLADNPWNSGANTGDTVTCILTLTNGVAITNVLVASAGEQVTNLLERLRGVILTNTTLTATNGVHYERLANGPANVVWFAALFARTPGPHGAGIQVDYIIDPVSTNSGLVTNFNFSAFLDDNPDDVRPRASILFHVAPTNGVLDTETSLDTTPLADGLHVLDFIARDGSAVATPARLSLPIVVCNESPQLSVLGTNGAAIANGDSPAAETGADFGRVELGMPRTNLFAIHNNGPAALSIAGWTTNGSGAAAFAVSGVPAVIEAGGVSNFAVSFTPAAPGIHDAALSFDSDAILPQTNILFAGTGSTLHVLTVESDHGTANPPLGLHTNWAGTILTNSVVSPAPAGGTQLVCTGWAMTGHQPLSGSATNFTMTVTNDATLTWHWTTNYWLDTAAGPNGSVNVPGAWQPAGATTQLTATADLYYDFADWTGSVAATNNPLELLMDAPQSVQANFTALLATNATPHWWLALHGWTNNFDDAALDDPDEDGYFTWQEYIADTDPTNGASFFPPLAATGSATNLGFGLDPTSTGRHYYIDVATPLGDPDWTSATNAPGTGGAWLPEITPPGTGLFFYRGRVTLPP